MAIVRDDKEAIERIVTRLDDVLQRWSLEISPEKTEALADDRQGEAGVPNINLRGETLKNVDTFFKYLGTYLTSLPKSRTAKKKKGTNSSREGITAGKSRTQNPRMKRVVIGSQSS